MQKKNFWINFGVDKMIKFLKNYIEDIFIFIGLILINFATYRISLNLGLYASGFTSLGLGIYFARKL